MAEAQHDEEEQGLVEATLDYIARSLVEHPDDVRVSSARDERGLVVRLEVHPEDMGRIIGRSGRTARAVRAVVKAAAAKAGVHAIIRIDDRETPATGDQEGGGEPSEGPGGEE